MAEGNEKAAAPQAPPLNLPAAITTLLLCQLAGEALVQVLRLVLPGLTFPGPVVGMALMFAYLAWRGGPDASLDATAGAILRNLSLLFIPAAVGIVQYGGLIMQFGVPIVLALLVSTVLALVVTVCVFLLVARNGDET